jgi:O-antigen/teichoic acid export membrane protein
MDNTPDKKRPSSLLSNIIILLIGNSASAVFSFLITYVLARSLGTFEFGVYSGILALVLPLSIMVEFGISTLIIREISQDFARTHAYVRVSIKQRLLMSGSAFLLGMLYIQLFPSEHFNTLGMSQVYLLYAIALPMTFILPMFNLFSAVFRAYGKAKYVVSLNIIMISGQSLLLLLFLPNSPRESWLSSALVINTLTSLVEMLIAWVIYEKQIRPQYPTYKDTLSLSELLKAALPFGIASVIGGIYLRIGVLMTEQLAGASVVGIYVAMSRLISVVSLVSNAIYDGIYPRFSALINEPERKMGLFRLSLLVLVAYGILVMLVIQTNATWIINTIFGNEYRQGEIILFWMLVLFVISIISGSLKLFAYASGHESSVNYLTAFSIVLTVFIVYFSTQQSTLTPIEIGTRVSMSLVISELIITILLYAWIFGRGKRKRT